MINLPSPALGLLLFFAPLVLDAQIFTGTGAPIPANGTPLELPLEVTGLPAPLSTAGFGLEQVCITINHSWLADVEASIVAPDGTARILTTGQGWDTHDYDNTCFRSDAAIRIEQAYPPYNGTFRPTEEIGWINNGQDGNGTWKLRVVDTYPWSDNGSVIGWSITFGNAPAAPYVLASSDLPIVVINTGGQTIPANGKITADMQIVYNGPGQPNFPAGPFNEYNGLIGIELHGNSSISLSPKKSYTVELRDAFGQDLNAPLLGMPAESDWVLVANYFDKSLMNNTLTYHLARAMGSYAPRHRNVEVLVNGQYMGVYMLVEKIKRGGGRLDIAKLQPDETMGDGLTGGYILAVERDEGPNNGFVSPFLPAYSGGGQYIYLNYKYPKPSKIVPEQKAYIQAYVDSFETALAGPDFLDPVTGYRAYADPASFVDMFLLNELSRSVDAYRLSSYLYKDKDSRGGKLHAGPAWDYDLAWGNADYCDGWSTQGWAYQLGDYCSGEFFQIPFWWSRLLEDPDYASAVRCRWNELRDNILSPAYVSAYCDSVAAQLDAAQQRNFAMWPILGHYVWPNPSPIPTTYAGEVQELKDFMNGRWAWLDAHLPQAPACDPEVRVDELPRAAGSPYPNPFVDEIIWQSPSGLAATAKLMDPLGRLVRQSEAVGGNNTMQRFPVPAGLPQGIYLFLISSANGTSTTFRLAH
ncbi:MAG TPA: CotH kinase family protein [Flavobacteriales bacterium]|nr:CotH kinase family protein [Flavobacteriales bacterium]